MEDKKYPIELEVITPLSVGAGNDKEWVRGIDFIHKEGKVYVLDIQKAAELGVDIERLTNLFLKNDERGIIQLFGNQLDKVAKYVFSSNIRTDNNIKSFIRTQFFDKPVVVGSSIKGSIRSALFRYFRTSEEKNEEVFGTMKDGTDFMRFIRISDVEMPSTILVNSKIFNLRGHGTQWQGGWKHGNTNREGDTHTTGEYSPQGFNTLFECVAPGQKGLGSIVLAANAFNLLEQYGHAPITYHSKKRELIAASIQTLFKVINDATRTYLLKEKRFFEHYPAQRTEELIESIDDLLRMIPADNSSCLLKMSAGVGFHSITGDWQFNDYDQTGFWEYGRDEGKKKYKSRKTVEYRGKLQLMGFVRLRELTETEVLQTQQVLQQEHERKIESIMLPIRQQEQLQQKRAAEAEQRKQTLEAERQKQAHYETLILQARQLFDERRWEEAKAKAEAAAAYNIGIEHQAIIDSCNNEIAISKAEELILGGNTAFYDQSLVDVLAGKTSAGNLVGTAVKWLKGEGKSFTSVEFHAFVEAAKSLPEKERKKLTGKRKDLAKVIGEEQTKNLLIELGI